MTKENKVKVVKSHDWMRATVTLPTGEKIAYKINRNGYTFQATPSVKTDVAKLKKVLKGMATTYKLSETESYGEAMDRFVNDMKNFKL